MNALYFFINRSMASQTSRPSPMATPDEPLSARSGLGPSPGGSPRVDGRTDAGRVRDERGDRRSSSRRRARTRLGDRLGPGETLGRRRGRHVVEVDAVGPVGPAQGHPPAARLGQVDRRRTRPTVDDAFDRVTDRRRAIHPLGGDHQLSEPCRGIPGHPQDLVRDHVVGWGEEGPTEEDRRRSRRCGRGRGSPSARGR